MNGITVIASTIRPEKIKNILSNFNSQTYNPKELILILNRDDINIQRVRQLTRKSQNVSVFKIPYYISLGECLNYAVEKAKYPIISKFDDDDYYAPKYLTQARNALINTDAALVGKMSVSTYFEDKELLAIRRPNNENIFLNKIGLFAPHVGGGTMVWKKSLSNLIKFPDKNLGEDVSFQVLCENAGFKIYSTDRNYYVSIRRGDKRSHTWNAEDDDVLEECEVITRTSNYKSYVGGEE